MNNSDIVKGEEVAAPAHFYMLSAIDIETLSTDIGRAAVIQIGIACAEIRSNGELLSRKNYCWELRDSWTASLEDSERMAEVGVDPSTLRFHMPHLFTLDSSQLSFRSDAEVCINAWKTSSWGKGYVITQNAEFDLGILRAKLGETFYDFRKTIDIRTLQNLGLLPAKLPDKTHNALDDASAELDAVIGLIKDRKITLC